MQALLIIDMQGFVPDRIARGMAYFPASQVRPCNAIAPISSPLLGLKNTRASLSL